MKLHLDDFHCTDQIYFKLGLKMKYQMATCVFGCENILKKGDEHVTCVL